MKVLIDTSVWSRALRRSGGILSPEVIQLTSLIEDHRVQMIGPIRQELLSGIRSEEQFNVLKEKLSAFPDFLLKTDDFILAANFYNRCRQQGIQGSSIDFLICSVSVNNNWQIFTTDQDFTLYSTIIPIRLFRQEGI